MNSFDDIPIVPDNGSEFDVEGAIRDFQRLKKEFDLGKAIGVKEGRRLAKEEMLEFAEWYGKHIRTCGLLRMEPMPVDVAFIGWKAQEKQPDPIALLEHLSNNGRDEG